jgi:hypothetical protein
VRGEADCPFEKPILSGRCACELAARSALGEQLRVRCNSALACTNCQTLLALLRERGRFALKLSDPLTPIPFGKEMRLMVGGLVGLQIAMRGAATERAVVPDVHKLVQDAQARYGSLAQLPFHEIVKTIAAFQSRPRTPRG